MNTCPTCAPPLYASEVIAATVARSLRFGWPAWRAEREIRDSLLGFHAARLLACWRCADG